MARASIILVPLIRLLMPMSTVGVVGAARLRLSYIASAFKNVPYTACEAWQDIAAV